MFTYVPPIDARLTLRLGVACSARDVPAEYIPEGTFRFFPPTGATDDQERSWWEYVRAEIRPFDAGTEFAEHLTHHIAVVGELMSRVAAVNDGVAPTCQLAVHVAPYIVGISGLIGDGSPFTMDWGPPDTDEEKPPG
jgi:hypothetical protein